MEDLNGKPIREGDLFSDNPRLKSKNEPPAPSFTSREQKQLREMFLAEIISPKAQWQITGNPGIVIYNLMEKTAKGCQHTAEFYVDEDVLSRGRWEMDGVSDVLEGFDAEDILITPEKWEIRGKQATFAGENSTMFVQPNGDGTYFFVAYSHSLFFEKVAAKPKETFDVQLRFMESDGL